MKWLIPSLLLTIFLCQSCVVYKKTPVSLQSAVERGRVKVLTTSGKKYKFKNIEFSQNGDYIGVKKKNTIQLNQALLTEIYLKDHKKSTWTTIVISVLGPALLIFVIIPLMAIAVNGIQI